MDLKPAPSAAKPEECLIALNNKEPLSLGKLLTGMSFLEHMLERSDDEFDEEDLVGSLSFQGVTDEQAAAIRAKIDSVRYVIEEFEHYAQRTRDKAGSLMKKAKSMEGKAERLRLYVLYQMKNLGFKMLAGDNASVQIKIHHTPRAIPTRPAEAKDYNEHPTLVEMVPREYVWNNRALVELWKKGRTAGADFVTYEFSERLEFSDRDRPAVIEKKKGKK